MRRATAAIGVAVSSEGCNEQTRRSRIEPGICLAAQRGRTSVERRHRRNRPKDMPGGSMKPAAVRFAAFLVGFYLLASGVQANAAIVITRSELSGGQLRVEGQGAQPNAPISVNGTVRGTADAGGRFKILAANFSSPTCSVTVSDGVTSAAASLIGCTSAPPPSPPPTSVIFGTSTAAGTVGAALNYQAVGSSGVGGLLAFVYNWGDGSTLRDPATGFYSAGAGSSVIGATVTHAWLTAGTFTVTVTAVDDLGRSVVSGPLSVTIAAASALPVVSSVLLNPPSMVGGNFSGVNTSIFGISLSAAPSAAAVITLSSSNPAVATVPASVTVSAGFMTAAVPVTTVPVTASTTVTISASFHGVTKTALLTVLPAPPVMLGGVTLCVGCGISAGSPLVVAGFGRIDGSVTLSNVPPFGGADVTVGLSSSNPLAATVPTTVTVPAGSSGAGFTVSTLSVTAV